MSRFVETLVPADQRDRYREEWQSNRAEAPELGIAVREVDSAALATASRLRVRWLGQVLFFRRSALGGVVAWLLCLPLVLVTWFHPLLFLLLQVYVITQVGQRRVLAGLLVSQVLSVVLTFWSWGVAFGSAEANRPAPWYAESWWVFPLGWALSTAGFWALAAWQSRPGRHAPR